MSRSYKKYPVSIYEKADARLSNRYVRRHPEIDLPAKGTAYKKVKSFGWNAKSYWSKKEAIDSYYKGDSWGSWRFQTLEEFLNWYEKNAIRK